VPLTSTVARWFARRRGMMPRETLLVPPIVHYGGPNNPIAQPKIKTFFELSLT